MQVRSPQKGMLCSADGVETKLRRQLLIFTYHKSGTLLLTQIMQRCASHFGFVIDVRYGLVHKLDPAPDVVVLAHSLIGRAFAARPFRAVRVVRDPRDIWVSGYLYHLRCREAWCLNTNFDPSPPIVFPRVDYSFAHYAEAWKQAYLEALGGKS